MKHNSLIPYLGEKTTKKRISELFSREVLGSILLGVSIGKVIEKVNMLIVAMMVIIIFPVEVSPRVWLFALLLLMWWMVETLLFISMYLKWEHWERAVQDNAEKVKEKTDEVKEKAEGESS